MNTPAYSTPENSEETAGERARKAKRNRESHERHKRKDAALKAENELLHRRLAAVYDALNLK